MLYRIIVHWKTSVAGLSVTAILGIISATYVPGMTWKHWLGVAAPMLIGAMLKDPGTLEHNSKT